MRDAVRAKVQYTIETEKTSSIDVPSSPRELSPAPDQVNVNGNGSAEDSELTNGTIPQ